MQRLRNILRRIDGRGYKAYKDLKGSYDFAGFALAVDHVQGDPYAAPTRISVRVPAAAAGFPAHLWNSPVRRKALEDYLGRAVAAAIGRHVKGRRGTGKSGRFDIATSGQQILVRNAVLMTAEGVEARLTVGLPAAGRTVLGEEAETMLCRELPQVVKNSLYYASLPAERLAVHVESVEDQDVLRRALDDLDLVAFVADGAVLPRRSGIDDRPLETGAVPFTAPESLALTVDLPNAGSIRGMGIPAGVTLIVGGGFHGKSTLLHALERGVYDHLPGDGRERIATEPSAVKIRAEDGRAITDVNIAPFIDNLPLGRDTRRFATENASGSTSQAANIMEALEAGARTLLIDEDTSATNFMIRDARMQTLVAPEKEPITPLLHRIRELYERHGVSTILVMGGSGDYFAVADTVIMLDTYRVHDVTAAAHRLAGNAGTLGDRKSLPPLDELPPRRPDATRLDPMRGGKIKIAARGVDALLYGSRDIDLGRVEQLVDPGQTEAIGWLMRHYARHHADRHPSLILGLQAALRDVEERGLDLVAPWKSGEFALPRLFELAAAVNRLRKRG